MWPGIIPSPSRDIAPAGTFSCGRAKHLAVARCFARPRLAARPAGLAALRPAPLEKDWRRPVFFVSCGHGYFACRRKQNSSTPPRLFCLLAKHASGWHMYRKTARRCCFSVMCPRQESNLHYELRKLAFYPLNYGSNRPAHE